MMFSSLFDAYYSRGCSRPCQRDGDWLTFFDQIAKRIIEQFEPKTVLEAGLCLGVVVESLRKRDVEGYGGDISDTLSEMFLLKFSRISGLDQKPRFSLNI